MTHEERWPQAHPMCTCPEMTFSGPMPDRAECRRKAYPVDPHPVVSADDLRERVVALRRRIADLRERLTEENHA